MIWIYVFAPVVLVAGIAIFFGVKNGSEAPDESQLVEHLKEYPPENFNSHNGI